MKHHDSLVFCYKLFDNQRIRSAWDEEKEEWYFSVVDVVDTEQLLRIIQSIPSSKAEPFKMWLAQIGRERIDHNKIEKELDDRVLPSGFFTFYISV